MPDRRMSNNTTKNRMIRIEGAKQNNLKNLDLEIMLNRLTVITGVSGSGKSSLAFDTLYAEGQRRYVETFSPYARQFMDRMDRPQVDDIQNIPPAIAIDRKDPVRTSRSTVGTMTEVTDYVKLLFARLGRLHCRKCGEPVGVETPEDVWMRLKEVPTGSEIIISFPFDVNGLTEREVRKTLGEMGFDRYVQEGGIRPIDTWQAHRNQRRLHILMDRVRLRPKERGRIIDSAEQAYHLGKQRLDVWMPPDRHMAFSHVLECATCKIQYHRPVANQFSFNSPIGACDTCRGFGRTIDIDLGLIIPDTRLSLAQGAIKPWGTKADQRSEFSDLARFCGRNNISLNIPFRDLPAKHRGTIIDGSDDYYGIRGFFRWLESRTYKMPVRVYLSRYHSYNICPDCRGSRFKEATLLYRLNGLNIAEVYQQNVEQIIDFFNRLSIAKRDEASELVLAEVLSRLTYLRDVEISERTSS